MMLVGVRMTPRIQEYTQFIAGENVHDGHGDMLRTGRVMRASEPSEDSCIYLKVKGFRSERHSACLANEH